MENRPRLKDYFKKMSKQAKWASGSAFVAFGLLIFILFFAQACTDEQQEQEERDAIRKGEERLSAMEEEAEKEDDESINANRFPDAIHIPEIEEMGYEIAEDFDGNTIVSSENNGAGSLKFSFSQLRTSPLSSDDPAEFEAYIYVKIGYNFNELSSFEAYEEGNNYYLEAKAYQENMINNYESGNMPEMNVLDQIITSDTQITYTENAPWELFPEGIVTGLYYERDLDSYLFMELFMVSESDYPEIIQSIKNFYGEVTKP